MAMSHYQFEAIHPFSDGNGRTGRILNILYLADQGLLEIPVLYLSRYIIQNKRGYYEGLRAVTEQQAWEPWILYMLEAVEITAKETLGTVLLIMNLITETQERVKNGAPKVYSKELVEMLFEHPYCKIRFIEQAGLAKRQTAGAYLKALADLEVVEPVKIGREVYYINSRLVSLLKN
jgi:Fic family protein